MNTKTMLMSLRTTVLAVISAAVLSASEQPALASAFIYHFVDVFDGTAPAGVAPWVDASFEDVSPGTVRLTIDNVGISGSEKVSGVYFNLNPAFSALNLSFTLASVTAGVGVPVIRTGTDQFKAGGDGKYDVLFSFEQASAGAFGSRDQIVYFIGGIPGLSVADFVCWSAPAGGHGPFLAAAHVQSITRLCNSDPGALSGWISSSNTAPIPEPGPAAVALLGAVLLVILNRRRQ